MATAVVQNAVAVTTPTARVPTLVSLSLVGWTLTMIVLGALLVLRHKVPLRETELDPRTLGVRIGKTRQADEAGKWLAVHVLYEGCGCSARVLNSLLEHDAQPGIVERVAIVSEHVTTSAFLPELRRRGYHPLSLTRDDMVARYGVQSAPSLALLAPNDELRYLGGYSRRKRGPVLEDREIIRRTTAGELVPALPTFGCAVGRRLEARVNPLGL